ncbi:MULTISPECIES: heavy metal translocating P-type ATPase [unclassified Rathayibacter]|uniref:heavy metal translocating P-type ATPase n=1 Tax=unclassified Rathayibacter TaxID=2609250 RepID=UPI00188D6079|nr:MULTISPECIES: heavy metal translocating P-type ATPase [unclassified Rathayibacter]MBF4463254.1 copper-translocating P-type ATPase [Rathayibacter sp. VKM Ac-2879]MBF4504509.1 copper-translocating P-type ATPase [Rathayibacter sp. VKM Ac-2878]
MAAGTPLELAIGGMTCASCVARVERRLDALPGVAATVNLALERATLTLPPGTTAADAIAAVEAAGYTATVPDDSSSPDDSSASGGTPEPGADERERRALLVRLRASALLAAPVVALSMLPALQFANWQWLCLALASPVAVWGALPFHRNAWRAFRHGSTTMDTLISLGVSAAFLWSLFALFLGDAGRPGMSMPFELLGTRSGHDEIYLEVAAAVPVLVLTGRFLEARSKRDAGAALRALLRLGAKEAVRVSSDGSEERVPAATLMVGDRLRVRPGEIIAADGTVLEGASAIDASLLTGESVPVEARPGSTVTGGALTLDGSLLVRVDRVGSATTLARMGRLVSEAQAGKAQVQRLADRVSSVFVPVVVALALATLVGWLLAGADLASAISPAVAVLVVACPCALGLATPTAVLVGTGRGAQLGILIRGPEVLEASRTIDTIVFDKTGTLTTGAFKVSAASGDESLRLLAAVERESEHPLAAAIVREARERGLALPETSGFRASAGDGVRAHVEGRLVIAGRLRWLEEQWGFAPGTLSEEALAAARDGGTVVGVGWDGELRGFAVLRDQVRPEAADTVARLQRRGLRTLILTGDTLRAARGVASAVGIDEVVAEVLPEEKLALVQRLRSEGRSVALVGDGVNDAAALAAADLGIAMGAGADAAIEASDITLVGDDLARVPDALRLGRRTLGVIRGNLFWAFAYNVAAIPLAMAGLLGPLVAGAAMAFSSVFVVLNSLRLRSFR